MSRRGSPSLQVTQEPTQLKLASLKVKMTSELYHKSNISGIGLSNKNSLCCILHVLRSTETRLLVPLLPAKYDLQNHCRCPTSFPDPDYGLSFSLIATGGGVLRRRGPSSSRDEIGLCLKATFHSTNLDISVRRMHKDQSLSSTHCMFFSRHHLILTHGTHGNLRIAV